MILPIVHALSVREKREFYAGLARLIRSGTSLPAALELLARDTPRRVSKFLRALNSRIKAGDSLGDALLQQRPRVSELESSILTAAGRGGRLDAGCEQLGRYYEALDRARGEVRAGAAYPVVMFHLIFVVMNVPLLLTAGLSQFLWATLQPLGIIYGFVAGIWLFWGVLVEAARYNIVADRLIRLIPGIGPIREKFALARFFATLDAQLEAAVNIWDAFANAARTSDSARVISAARKAMPLLQAGEPLSEVLAVRKVIPPDYIRSFRVAEQAGELDAELTAMARRSEEQAVAALKRWSEWLPRMIYAAVLFYGAWRIVSWYANYLNQVNNIDPFNH